MFENGDFCFYSGELSTFYEECARNYSSEKNSEKALECLKKAAHLSIDFITFMQKDTFTHTSLFLKGMVKKTRNVSLNSKYNQVVLILKNMESREYDIIRETEKFKHISDMLESYIKTN